MKLTYNRIGNRHFCYLSPASLHWNDEIYLEVDICFTARLNLKLVFAWHNQGPASYLGAVDLIDSDLGQTKFFSWNYDVIGVC